MHNRRTHWSFKSHIPQSLRDPQRHILVWNNHSCVKGCNVCTCHVKRSTIKQRIPLCTLWDKNILDRPTLATVATSVFPIGSPIAGLHSHPYDSLDGSMKEQRLGAQSCVSNTLQRLIRYGTAFYLWNLHLGCCCHHDSTRYHKADVPSCSCPVSCFLCLHSWQSSLCVFRWRCNPSLKRRDGAKSL